MGGGVFNKNSLTFYWINFKPIITTSDNLVLKGVLFYFIKNKMAEARETSSPMTAVFIKEEPEQYRKRLAISRKHPPKIHISIEGSIGAEIGRAHV